MANTSLTALYRLLNDVLHSDALLEREYLHSQILANVPAGIRFFIIVAEQRRFAPSRSDLKTDRLYLPFLSFGVDGGAIRTFSSPEAVDEFVQQSESSGLFVAWENQKAIVLTGLISEEAEEFVRVAEQIILTFYYACGHYDHFMSNASRRFVKSFLRERRSLATNEVMKAITENTNCDAIYLEYANRSASPEIIYDPTAAYAELSICNRFQADLHRALQRKATFSGRSTTGIHYVVNVASLDRGYDSIADMDRSLSSAAPLLSHKRHVLILCKYPGPISMDAVKFGPRLFHLHLTNDAFSVRERLIFDIFKGIAEYERGFVTDPPKTKPDLDAIALERFDYILRAASGVTAAELLVLRLYDPFTKCLVPVAAVKDGQAISLLGMPPVGVRAGGGECAAFLSGQTVGVLRLPSYVSRIMEAFPPTGPSDIGIAGFVFPLNIGRLTSGVLECYSRRRAQLQFDEEYLKAIADAVGETARRLEAAADVAWLSRLSFLHSARHELENFLPQLADLDANLHASLLSTLEKYSGFGPSPWDSDDRPIATQIAELMSSAADGPEAVGRFVEDVETLSVFEPDSGFRFMLAEVLSTLVTNANKHSTFRVSDFKIEFTESDQGHAGLAVTYQSIDKRIPVERAERVAMAPIRDARNTTYHYGLFLLAAQVRMNGGTVHVRTDVVPVLDSIPFEICFTLPLHPLGDGDAN